MPPYSKQYGHHLHRTLQLNVTPSKFYIEPDNCYHKEVLIIDRQTCEITSHNDFSLNQITDFPIFQEPIYGIIGVKHVKSFSYLIVISEATQIGRIDKNYTIYRMDRAKVIPYNVHMTPPKDGQVDWNLTYKSMLESLLETPSFYFSYTYDLTNSYQRTSDIWQDRNLDQRNSVSVDVATIKFHEYDKRFLWNNHVMSSFDCCNAADRYRLPFIFGFVKINELSSDGSCLILISRRSVDRAGTRFNCRGLDYDGKVANFVETEQIFEENPNNQPGMGGNYGKTRASFVQVRGSIPLKWSQQANYRYMPSIVLESDVDHTQLMVKHFLELVSIYKRVSVVNLIDRRGREADLEREFSRQMEHIRDHNYDIPYHYFDFHKECSKMRWQRLSILIERIQSDIDSFGSYFEHAGKIIEKQKGVIRSNCIDSLDRTNVVQSMIAKKVLESQLQRSRFIRQGASLEDYPDIFHIFKNTWADNADALSVQYAGTPALKTDFTRTGQRTSLGLVMDGLNSMTRYVTNNFFDQYRQDAIDLFLGKSIGLYQPWNLTSYTSTLPVTIVILTLVALYLYLRY